MIIPNLWENKIDVPNHQPEKKGDFVLAILVEFPKVQKTSANVILFFLVVEIPNQR